MNKKTICDNCRHFLYKKYSITEGVCMLPVFLGFPFVKPVYKKFNDSCNNWDEFINQQDKKILIDGFFNQLKHNKKYKRILHQVYEYG